MNIRTGEMPHVFEFTWGTGLNNVSSNRCRTNISLWPVDSERRRCLGDWHFHRRPRGTCCIRHTLVSVAWINEWSLILIWSRSLFQNNLIKKTKQTQYRNLYQSMWHSKTSTSSRTLTTVLSVCINYDHFSYVSIYIVSIMINAICVAILMINWLKEIDQRLLWW